MTADAHLVTARRMLLLALADDELITGHRTSHWTGVAPSLEEDLALSTIAQDEINHADVWYQVLLVGERGEAPRDAVDALGLGRDPGEYRHAVLCERPPRDFAYTLARHWLYDHADDVRLAALEHSTDADVAAVARKLRHEERYHLEHADHWVGRLAAADDEAVDRLRTGVRSALSEAAGLFAPLPGEAIAVAAGLLPDTWAVLGDRWRDRIAPTLQALDLAPPADLPADTPDGRTGAHTPDFTDDVWPEMTHLYRAHPGAVW